MDRPDLGTASIIRANSRNLPLADNSVDLVVTSPPYFALRSYQDGGEHYAGQIGDEPTPDEFVSSLLEVTAECVRVLKPSGSLWVNLGDKYATGATPGPQSASTTMTGGAHKGVSNVRARKVRDGVPAKSLIGIPWRYALRCIDDLGLILRAEVIWSKPNGLPESVTDRVRRSHEQWFHFTLEPRYFSAVDEIREECEARPTALTYAQRKARGMPMDAAVVGARHSDVVGTDNAKTPHPLGKLPGSVWTVPTEPLRVPDHLGIDHFAAFPTEWPKRIIQGWSPAGVCVECGEGRRPVAVAEQEHIHTQRRTRGLTDLARPNGEGGGVMASGEAQPVTRRLTTIAGYACACGTQEGSTWTPFSSSPTAVERTTQTSTSTTSIGSTRSATAPVTPPPTRPAVVLDPFGGTGTTAMVAKALGRHGISVDMSADYCRLAEWRTNDRDQLAKVLGVAKAEQQDDAQESLFDVGPIAPKRNVSVSLQGDRTCQECGYRSQYARKPACDKCGAPRSEGVA